MIFLLVFVIGAAITRKQLSDISNWWTIVATIANIVTIAVLVLSAKKNGMISPIPKQLAVINFLFLPITTAFAEDGLYLGCEVNAIENKAAAIVIPALFSGIGFYRSHRKTCRSLHKGLYVYSGFRKIE